MGQNHWLLYFVYKYNACPHKYFQVQLDEAIKGSCTHSYNFLIFYFIGDFKAQVHEGSTWRDAINLKRWSQSGPIHQ